MNKTTALVGILSGFAGAGIVSVLKSCDTTRGTSATTKRPSEPNASGPGSPTARISPEAETRYRGAVRRSQDLARAFKDEIGTPGLVVGVSVDGKSVWEEGFGYANLETRTPCTWETAMRIASISKPITMTLLAKLKEGKAVEYDKSVHEYVPYYPRKVVDGEDVDITVRQLASHTAGVRHYRKKGETKDKDNRDSGKEFYYKEKVDSVKESVEMFSKDDLLFKPGTGFEYTTHGYTLISAVIEAAGRKPFTEQIQEMFRVLDLRNTHLDRVQTLVHGRASYYDKNSHGRLVNAKLADTSYKWAGGGFVSTVEDLTKFGNVMLYSYQQRDTDQPGYLKPETVRELWTSVDKTTMKWGRDSGYGLGWTVVPKIDPVGGVQQGQRFHVGHSGGAVGASSVLLIVPRDGSEVPADANNNAAVRPPQGVVVAVLVNLENVSCKNLGKSIAEEFLKA